MARRLSRPSAHRFRWSEGAVYRSSSGPDLHRRMPPRQRDAAVPAHHVRAGAAAARLPAGRHFVADPCRPDSPRLCVIATGDCLNPQMHEKAVCPSVGGNGPPARLNLEHLGAAVVLEAIVQHVPVPGRAFRIGLLVYQQPTAAAIGSGGIVLTHHNRSGRRRPDRPRPASGAIGADGRSRARSIPRRSPARPAFPGARPVHAAFPGSVPPG